MDKVSKTQIYIVDDDEYPVGRATKVTDKLIEKGYKVEHLRTFAELKELFYKGIVNRCGLFVMDSSLDHEPDGKYVDFESTIPFLISHEVYHKHILPASGAKEGPATNRWFFEYLDRRDLVPAISQSTLEVFGLSGKTDEVVRRIDDYYKELYPTLMGEGCGPSTLVR